VNIMLQRFFYNKREMRAFGAIAIEIFALIAMLFHRGSKHFLCLVDLHPDLRQIRQLQRSAVLVDQRFEIEPVKLKITVIDIETFLREVEGLFHQIGVGVVLLIQLL